MEPNSSSSRAVTGKTILFHKLIYGFMVYTRTRWISWTYEIISQLETNSHAWISEVGFVFRNYSAQFFKPHPNTTARLARVKVNYGNSLYHSQSASGQHLGENEFWLNEDNYAGNFLLTSLWTINMSDGENGAVVRSMVTGVTLPPNPLSPHVHIMR